MLGRPLTVAQVTWWSPMTTRLLAEAGFSSTYFGVGNFERTPNPTIDLIRVSEQCASGCAANGNIPGLVYRSQDFSVAYTGSYLWQGVAHLRHGRASAEGRVSAHPDDGRSHLVHQHPGPDVSLRQRRSEPADGVDLALGQQHRRRLGRPVRRGAMDGESAHSAGGTAFRSRLQLVSRAAGRTLEVSVHAHRHSKDARRVELQGPVAENRRHLRRLRHGHDRTQAEPRPVSGRSRLIGDRTPTPIPRCGCPRRPRRWARRA